MLFIKRSHALLYICALVANFVVPHFVFAAEDASEAHPFYMSPDINAATIRAMGNDVKITTEAAGISQQQSGKVFKKVKIIDVITADDFSYLQVEKNQMTFWIAGINVSAKTGDYIQYIENVSMHDFKSKALNRVFDQVMFVSEVSVLNDE